MPSFAMFKHCVRYKAALEYVSLLSNITVAVLRMLVHISAIRTKGFVCPVFLLTFALPVFSFLYAPLVDLYAGF